MFSHCPLLITHSVVVSIQYYTWSVCSTDIGAGSGHRSVKLPSELNVALLADITEHTPSPFTQSQHSVHQLPQAKARLCPPLRKVTGQAATRLHPILATQTMTLSKVTLRISRRSSQIWFCAALLSRVKSIAAQHGQGEAIQRPVKMMRDLISSLATTLLAGHSKELEGWG